MSQPAQLQSEQNNSNQQRQPQASGSGAECIKAGFCLALIFALTLAAYSPVLFNFFNGDDFVHLSWLSEAIHRPELVLRNFYTSWLDGTTTRFYRPLISVFMVSDYAVWGVNGLGFRLTNIAFHLAGSLFIFLIAGQLLQTKNSSEAENKQGTQFLLPYAAAAIFALHPLHPEAVSWITGRVDSVVTAFCLASLYFYISFSKSKKGLWLFLSLASASLGLLSKEMAITLPAIFFAYEFLYADGSGKTKSVAGRFFNALIKSLPFFLLLSVYFLVRRLALGTFVGGYDNSLFFIADPKAFFDGWGHALKIMLVPINKALLGSRHIMSILTPVTVLSTLALSTFTCLVEAKNRKHLVFALSWFAFSLLPVYKLFNIADDLQGSRLAYLATAPLALLLSFALLQCGKLERFKLWQIGKAFLVLCLTVNLFALLWINNQPWKDAGETSNAIRSGLCQIYSKIDGDPQALFLGLPDQINGAYTCRNALDGMTKKPQLQRDIRNCLMVNGFEPIFPFGYLKESIRENQDRIKIFRWNEKNKAFQSLRVPEKSEGIAQKLSGKNLEQAVRQSPQSRVKVTKLDGEVLLQNQERRPQFVDIDLGPGSSCFDCDFVCATLELETDAREGSGADLLYSNDLYPDFELKRRAHAHFKPGSKEQQVIFPLRGLPEWALGGEIRAFRLLIPANSCYKLKSIEIKQSAQLAPRIEFANSGYFGSKGYLHLGPKEQEQIIQVDLSNIEKATGFALEISRTNLLFEEQNTTVKSKVAQDWKLFKAKKQDLKLNYADFSGAGLYELRIFPLDKNGKPCSVCSDHLAISVD